MLITLAVITILLTISLELNRNVRSMVTATAATRDRLQLTNISNSGIHAAMAMLVKDKMQDPPSGLDSIQEDWKNPEKVGEVLQDITFPKGRVTFEIFDELGKIQVNALVKYPGGRQFNDSQKIMWDRFSRLLISQDDTFDDLEAPAIINCVKDWLDFGDDDAITGLSGAESDYYKGLDPPYECRNGPMPHISDLLMVKGVIPELYYGTNELPGISEFITTYGMVGIKGPQTRFTFPGKININTADLPVLIAVMPSENPEYAQAIYDYRQEKDAEGNFMNSLLNPNWYKNAPGIPSDLQIDPNLITVSSDIFRIHAEAKLNDMSMAATAVVQREKNKKSGKWECRILSLENG